MMDYPPLLLYVKGRAMPDALTELEAAVRAVQFAADGGQQDEELDEAIDRLPAAFDALTAAMVADGLLKITLPEA